MDMKHDQAQPTAVNHVQLHNRRQKTDTSSQEYEVDIARLIRLAWPYILDAILERISIEAFV